MGSFFLVAAALFAVIGVFYLRWVKRVEEELQEGADFEWARFQRQEPEFLGPLTEADFSRIYRRALFPRFPKYALGALACFALALPIVLGVLGASVWLGESTGVYAQPEELAKYVPLSGRTTSENQAQRQEMALYIAKDFQGFYFFFGVIFSWLLIVTLFARHFYAHRPGYLRDELIRAREAAEGE